MTHTLTYTAGRYFLDTEFYEDGSTIELISLALVEDVMDRELYLAVEHDQERAKAGNPWLIENVYAQLPPESEWVTRDELRAAILGFVADRPEFWGYYADYDWVVLCQLFGRMIDLPKGWPMYCRDVKQLLDEHGNPRFPKPENEHNALADARWAMKVWRSLVVDS